MRLKFVAPFVMLAGLVVMPVRAADVTPVLKGGFDFGGDTLVTVVFTGGETDSIKANEGMYIGGGVSILNQEQTFEVELTLNYKFSEITASNGDISWTVMPVDALAFYRVDQWRLGGGVTYHMSPEVDGSGVASGVDMDFENAFGIILQADYRLADKFTVGLRYISLEYEEKTTGATAKSNGVGLTASVRF